MEKIKCSETSAFNNQTPGKYPKDYTQCPVYLDESVIQGLTGNEGLFDMEAQAKLVGKLRGNQSCILVLLHA